MPGTAPWDLVGVARDGAAPGVSDVEDPALVAAELAHEPGVTVVDAADLPAAVAAARVRLAVLLVGRAREAEALVVGPGQTAPPEQADEADADRQAVRFALAILLLALPAGLAVYAADGMWLAPVLPGVALVALGAVVLVHRSGEPVAATRTEARPQLGVDDAPAVRAAEAHLRRQQAAWKLTWWERAEPVPDLDDWSPEVAGASITLVVVDDERSIDEGAHATMTATAPAAVRVVVLHPRAGPVGGA